MVNTKIVVIGEACVDRRFASVGHGSINRTPRQRTRTE